jgi:hypothetical protein
MSLFDKTNVQGSKSPIPIASIDLAKRYDIYYSAMRENWVFQNTKFLGVKTLERMNQFSSGLIGGWVEIEASNGTKMLIRNHSIYMICETGSTPIYKVIPQPIADSKQT